MVFKTSACIEALYSELPFLERSEERRVGKECM